MNKTRSALALLLCLAIPLGLLPMETGTQVETYQVTHTGDGVADSVVTFAHGDSTEIWICNTGSNAGYVRFGTGNVYKNTHLKLAAAACTPSLFVRVHRVAFNSDGAGTTFQMIVVYK